VIELVFGVQDLARTRFSISPMEQLLIGSLAVDARRQAGPQGRWWRGVRSRVPRKSAPFLELLAASTRGVPDFLVADDTAYLRFFSDELDSILASSDDQIRAELGRCYGRNPPPVVQRLRDEGRRALMQVLDAARVLYRECLAPDWGDMRRALDADVQRRVHTVAERGPAAMLDSIHSLLAWHETGTLTLLPASGAARPPVRHSLAGQGLQIRPNLFLDKCCCVRQPGRPAALLCPASSGARTGRPPRPADGLPALIRPARSRALRAIGQGPCTTTELAATLGIAPSSASAHTNVLRTAGLISTTRHGRQVQHCLTTLGHDLLSSNLPGLSAEPFS